MGVLGAVLGDIAGSRFEGSRLTNTAKMQIIKKGGYPLFIKDNTYSYLSVIAVSSIDGIKKNLLGKRMVIPSLKKYMKKYNSVSFPDKLAASVSDRSASFSGRGDAVLRAVSIGERCKTKSEVLALAGESTLYTDTHPEEVKASQVVAMIVFMAENGVTKEEIAEYAARAYPSNIYRYGCDKTFHYDCDMKVSTVSSDSVPVAINCFLNTTSFADCMYYIHKINCNVRSVCAIAGAICDSYYGNCTPNDERVLRRYVSAPMYRKILFG